MKIIILAAVSFYLIGTFAAVADEQAPANRTFTKLYVINSNQNQLSWRQTITKLVKNNLGGRPVSTSKVNTYQKYSIGYSLSNDDKTPIVLYAGMNPNRKSAGVSLEVSW